MSFRTCAKPLPKQKREKEDETKDPKNDKQPDKLDNERGTKNDDIENEQTKNKMSVGTLGKVALLGIRASKEAEKRKQAAHDDLQKKETAKDGAGHLRRHAAAMAD